MKKNLILICAMLISAVAMAQLTTDNVIRSPRRSSDAIKEGSEIKGYYFFYINDKIDKKTNEYTLRILDDNLKLLKDVKFQDSKDVTILESSFNGKDIVFLFYNEDAKTLEYKIYGADGKLKPYNYVKELTKKDKRYLEMTYRSSSDDENTFKGLYPVEGKGFISNIPSREDKDYTFEINYYSSEKRKTWTWLPTGDAKRFVGDYLGSANGVAYIEVLKFGSLMDQKPESFVIGLNLETGRQVFEKSTEQSKYKFYPGSMNVLNNGKSYLFGEYFDANDNIIKDKSRGFAFWGIDEKGTITSEKYCSWDLDMGKYISVSSKGKIDEFGYMCLHNMVQTSDGSIYAIGEGFKKVASALGIASKILSRNSGVSTVKIKITDMILIKFDENFNVKDAKIYDKGNNSVEMPSGAEFSSGPLLAKAIKYNWGGFDYAYTQVSADATHFSVCYSDWIREKDYKGGTFNSISYNDGKITTDRINTKSEASDSWIMPGKTGQVVIVEYFKKAKQLKAHFEKLN